MIPASNCPLSSTVIAYLVEAVRDGKFFSAKAGVCAFQIFLSSLVGRFAGKFSDPSLDLLSARQLSAVAVTGLSFALIRKGFGEIGESFGSNFGYGLAVSTAGAVTKGMLISRGLASVGSTPMVVGGGTAALVPYFPSASANLVRSIEFPAINPGCGSLSQLSYGDDTLSACIVPRLAQQNTFVI